MLHRSATAPLTSAQSSSETPVDNVHSQIVAAEVSTSVRNLLLIHPVWQSMPSNVSGLATFAPVAQVATPRAILVASIAPNVPRSLLWHHQVFRGAYLNYAELVKQIENLTPQSKRRSR